MIDFVTPVNPLIEQLDLELTVDTTRICSNCIQIGIWYYRVIVKWNLILMNWMYGFRLYVATSQ